MNTCKKYIIEVPGKWFRVFRIGFPRIHTSPVYMMDVDKLYPAYVVLAVIFDEELEVVKVHINNCHATLYEQKEV